MKLLVFRTNAAINNSILNVITLSHSTICLNKECNNSLHYDIQNFIKILVEYLLMPHCPALHEGIKFYFYDLLEMSPISNALEILMATLL